MGEVVGIKGEKPALAGEPNAELIGVVENLLERAKSGQLQSLVATGFCSDGARLSIFSAGDHNVYEMLGAINWLEHEYVDRVTGKVGPE